MKEGTAIKLIVGILLMAMSVVYIVYGEKMLAEGLEKQKTDSFLLTSSRVMSLQGGLIVFIVGLLEVLTYTNAIILIIKPDILRAAYSSPEYLFFLGVDPHEPIQRQRH